MMPLWTTAISLFDTCGCAFTCDGAPCVAQRVCEMPVKPARLRRVGLRGEIGDARGAHEALERRRAVAADDREPRRIVAAILEAADAVDQHRNHIARRDRADDTAHGV